ncbi:MAG: VOC family protein [Sphingomonadales bacterium]|nr:VOC family protein [Sphingomonadales bacterium]
MPIKALGYLVVATAQPQEWHEFLTRLVGAMPAGSAGDGARLYRVDDRVFRFRIEPAARERLLAAAYEVADADALVALRERIATAGQAVYEGSMVEAAERGVSAFFRTTDPAGNGLEFFHGDSRSDAPFVSPIGVPGFVTGSMGMGHAVFCAPDFDASVRFYRDVVGFHETDMPRFYFNGGPPADPGMGFAFLHADNGRHHSLALGEGPLPPSGCVHVMLELPSLVEVGKAHDRMKALGHVESATIGQHFNDETVGFYVRTPSGFDLEIGCDSLVIDPASWAVTCHTGISVWGHEWAWQKALKDAQPAQAAE